MRKRFKLLAVLMMMTIGFTLTGCSTYTSHGNGTMLVEHNDSDDAYFNFSTFDGTKVLKIKASSGDKMKYTGALDKGNVTVYYDNGGGKKELFTIGAGENVDSTLEGLEKGEVNIIIETDGEASEGKFTFEIE
jgi:hypothetical protein